MAIRILKHTEIDFNKYDACILKAKNTRIYALSWYLNTVTNKDWEAIVLDNYKAVMPLPYSRIKRKFLKRLIAQPLYCQQLGIFSIDELDVETFHQFLHKFEDLKTYVYHFNAENTKYLTNDLEIKNNYELNLALPYEEVKKNYSKNLTRNIKKAIKNELIVGNDIGIDAFIEMKNKYKKHAIKNKQYLLMKKLIAKIIDKKMGAFYVVKKQTDILAIAFIIESEKRFIHLFSASTDLGKQFGAMAFLFDNIIQKNANQNLILDFEGSMIEGVAQFFKSFGAENKVYAIQNNTN